MFRRSLFLLFTLIALVACGAPAQVSVQPTPAVVTRIATQVVTQVVIKKETVVVTATSWPETPTRAYPQTHKYRRIAPIVTMPK